MPRVHFLTGYRWGLLLLTAATGAVDAVSYLALDRVFTGNMTGNVLFIGFGLAGAEDIPLLNNVVALCGFVAGSIVGGRIVGGGHPARLTRAGGWVLVVGGLLALVLAGCWLVVDDLGLHALLALTGALAALMGAQVAAVKPIGNTDITTIVVTSTLANLARDSRLAGGRQPNPQAARDRLLAILAMGVGAAIGAILIRGAGGPAALLVAAVMFASGTGALLLDRLGQRRAESVI